MAQVTKAEYQNVKNTVNNQYTADSLQNYQNAYNDYKAQGMSTKDAVAKAQGLLVAKGTTAPSNSGTTTYSGTTGTTQSTTPTARQTTTVNQTEKPVSTTNEIKQQGQLKPLSQDYYNQTSSEAQDKIRYNLNSYRQSNPELFTDYESFKKNFSYDARDEVQKQTLDNWYKGYEKGLQLSSVPVNDLYTQYNSGQISSSDLEVLRNYNPTKYAELQNQINKGSIIQAYDDNKDTTGTSIQDMAYESAMQMFKQFMSGDSSSGASQYFQDYKNNLNSPEMLELSDKTTEIDEQRDNILDQISTMTKDVEKEYEGTGATKSKINAIVADRTYDLQQQLRTLDNEYKKYATQYNNRLQQYQNEFQLQLQEYQVNMQARQQQMSELGFAMDLMSFETPEQQQQRQWDYWVAQQEYTNGNINSKDYQTRYKAALSSVQNLLSQYEGIPMVRSAEQMAQDVLKAIDNGSDLGTELTKINQLIQQKPEYKYLYNQTFKPASADKISYDTFSLNGTDYIIYNNELLTADAFNKKYGGVNAVSPGIMNKGLESFKARMQSLVDTGGAIRKGWCGEPVNDYLKSIGSNIQYDNDKQTKLDSITPGAGPKVGSIAIWDGSTFNSPAAKEAGHVAIVTGVDTKNGTITVLESNGQAHKMGMGYGVYSMNNVTGYFDPSAGYKNTVDASGITWNTATPSTNSTETTTTIRDTGSNNVSTTITDYTSTTETPTFNMWNPYSGVIGTTSNGAEINAGGWITSLEKDFTSSARKSDAERKEIYDAYGIDAKTYKEMQQRYANYLENTQLYDSISNLRNTAQELLDWEETNNSKDSKGDLHTGWADIETVTNGYYSTLGGLVQGRTKAAEGYALYEYIKNNETLQKFLDLKNNGATFGAMQEAEWNLVGNSANKLDWLKQDKATFQKYLKEMINSYDKVLNKIGSPEVVEPNMSPYQEAPANDLGNGLKSRVVNGVTQYSGDGGKTWH